MNNVVSAVEPELDSGVTMLDNTMVPIMEGNAQFAQGVIEVEPWTVFQNQSEGWQTGRRGRGRLLY